VLKVLYSCITEQHDIRLVVLAGLVCIFGCFTAINLFVRAREAAGRRRLALVSAAAGVFGAGVWTTHFIAELAFKPGLPIAYDTGLTALSLGTAILVAWLGMLATLRYQRPILGGCVLGAAVGAMHYIGMAAMRVPADTHWSIAYIIASLTVGIAVAGAAAWVAWLGPAWRYRLLATVLLVAAICGLHFIGMAAIELIPNPLVAMPDNVVAPELLAVLVAAATIGIVMLGMLASIVEEQLGRRAKREADELRRSQEHLGRVLRISGIGSVERDLRTGCVEWSTEACRIFGVDPEEVQNTREYFYSLVHPDDRAKVRAVANQSPQGIASAPLEYRIIRPDGEVRVVYRENDLLLDETGHPVRRISVFKDVTEAQAAQEREKELERQLMHSQKLEALGTLAGGVAHDLNNTLVPIVALSKLALEELPEESPLRGDIETIIRASERARDLVKQILAFSRKEDLVRKEVDLVRVARDALQMLRASLPATIQIVDRILEVPKGVWRCRRAASGDRQSGNQCGTGDRRRCRQDNGRPVGDCSAAILPGRSRAGRLPVDRRYRLRHG
jgi:PAS domain S-box-containing protein